MDSAVVAAEVAAVMTAQMNVPPTMAMMTGLGRRGRDERYAEYEDAENRENGQIEFFHCFVLLLRVSF
jgi:hypothetical protein